LLVTIGGRPRYGQAAMMQSVGGSGETVTIAGTGYVVDFDTPDDDPDIEKVTLAAATQRLRTALANLGPLHADALAMAASIVQGDSIPKHGMRLALDEQFHNHVELRPRLPYAGEPTGPDLMAAAVAATAPVQLHPIVLDGLAVADDPAFLATLKAEQNLPAGIATAIAAYF
jgi:hypothetical protein